MDKYKEMLKCFFALQQYRCASLKYSTADFTVSFPPGGPEGDGKITSYDPALFFHGYRKKVARAFPSRNGNPSCKLYPRDLSQTC
ncbi:MAG: hypothetical protein NVSMB24_34360 [Mucilaginibacter sp.]